MFPEVKLLIWQNIIRIKTLYLSDHHICQDNTCSQPCKGCEQRAGKGVTCFGYFCAHKIDAHRIKDCLGAGHRDGCDQPGESVCTGFFVNVQQKSGGSGGRKHFYNGERNKLAGKPNVSGKMPDNG